MCVDRFVRNFAYAVAAACLCGCVAAIPPEESPSLEGSTVTPPFPEEGHLTIGMTFDDQSYVSGFASNGRWRPLP
jgi:hypothetical protein